MSRSPSTLIDQTILVTETNRPETGKVAAQRLGFVETRKRFLDQMADHLDHAVQELGPPLRQQRQLPASLPGEVGP